MAQLLLLKEKYMKILLWLRKNNIWYTLGVVISIVFAMAMILYWFVVTANLNAKSDTLLKTSSYSFELLQWDDNVKDTFSLRKTLSDVLGYEDKIKEDIINTNRQRSSNFS